ncbi:formate dehydrogenase accessory sulfurtransferase FdhD [Marinobacter psychrophilus]|jgi:FdhD protein|uniref:formate dehydrogenase accessory sulfurtransferase FdhD n=1 Tax=Marinobacter psychrophilus TaxID=330734 RepID=UPI001B554F9A|nr:formate dehydrogenase accessory sulfurtransferase FdhD [Marinobacter psychrophilus]MBQ0762171.1 formate dehydrogenase accessory sulfurtransferase FdhD [Marinobacter psychrophilus]MBQ0843745.1 formate dehydrogenase accessory sulfurtransferase FdhD [Marinobacter psychrophilus]
MPMQAPSNNGSPDATAAPTVECPAPVSAVMVNERGGIDRVQGQDWVAEEVPVAMVYNGVSHAVMMASPCDLEDFALGFSISEGILETPEQLFSIEIKPTQDGIELDMHIAGDCYARLREQRRNMVGRTGCGLCGTESLAHVARAIARVSAQPLPADDAVQAALHSLKNHQPLQLQTGATHGAAWCDSSGQIVQAREDVGRHNALDKLIGVCLREGGDQAFDKGFALISSRASFEMVQKSASVGISTLVAVSAPTALAIREARESGMNLIGFARPGRHVIYAPVDDTVQENTL